jgi:hypothetical protein
MSTCDGKVTMSCRDGYMEFGKLAPLTIAGTYTMVAMKSQMRPLRRRSVYAFKKYHDKREAHTLTCLHMRRPRPNTPGSWKPRRSKPTSIKTSKIMSVMKLMSALSVRSGMLTTMQLTEPGTCAEWTWGRRSVGKACDCFK